MRRAGDGGVAGELVLRGAFAFELGEGVGDGDGAAHAGAGDEADDGSVAGWVDGCEIRAFESEGDVDCWVCFALLCRGSVWLWFGLIMRYRTRAGWGI